MNCRSQKHILTGNHSLITVTCAAAAFGVTDALFICTSDDVLSWAKKALRQFWMKNMSNNDPWNTAKKPSMELIKLLNSVPNFPSDFWQKFCEPDKGVSKPIHDKVPHRRYVFSWPHKNGVLFSFFKTFESNEILQSKNVIINFTLFTKEKLKARKHNILCTRIQKNPKPKVPKSKIQKS